MLVLLFAVCCGLIQQVAQHHTVALSLHPFPVGWVRESGKNVELVGQDKTTY